HVVLPDEGQQPCVRRHHLPEHQPAPLGLQLAAARLRDRGWHRLDRGEEGIARVGARIRLDGAVAALDADARHAPAARQALLHVGDVLVEVARQVPQAAEQALPVRFARIGLPWDQVAPEEGVAVEGRFPGRPGGRVVVGLEHAAEHRGIDTLLRRQRIGRDRVERFKHLLPVAGTAFPVFRGDRGHAPRCLPAPVDLLALELLLAPFPLLRVQRAQRLVRLAGGRRVDRSRTRRRLLRLWLREQRLARRERQRQHQRDGRQAETGGLRHCGLLRRTASAGVDGTRSGHGCQGPAVTGRSGPGGSMAGLWDRPPDRAAHHPMIRLFGRKKPDHETADEDRSAAATGERTSRYSIEELAAAFPDAGAVAAPVAPELEPSSPPAAEPGDAPAEANSVVSPQSDTPSPPPSAAPQAPSVPPPAPEPPATTQPVPVAPVSPATAAAIPPAAAATPAPAEPVPLEPPGSPTPPAAPGKTG